MPSYRDLRDIPAVAGQETYSRRRASGDLRRIVTALRFAGVRWSITALCRATPIERPLTLKESCYESLTLIYAANQGVCREHLPTVLDLTLA